MELVVDRTADTEAKQVTSEEYMNSVWECGLWWA